MNEQQMLDDLDRRARTAAADLHTQAQARPVPEFDATDVRLPVTEARPSTGRRIMAVAAGLLLVGGVAAGVVAGNRDDKEQGPATESVPDPSPYILDPLQRGLTMGGFGEATSVDGGVQVGRTELFGPPGKDPELAVLVARGISPDDISEPDAYPVVHLGGGRTGHVLDGQGYGRRALVVDIDAKTSVVLSSSSLDRKGIETLGGAVQVDDATPKVPADALPDGWTHLGTANPTMGLTAPVRLSLMSRGTWASYSKGKAGILVQSTVGSDLDVATVGIFTDDPTRLTVRGHDAISGSASIPLGEDNQRLTVLAWLEEPGNMITLVGFGIDASELQALAEDVTKASDAEWEDLLRRTRLGDFYPIEGETEIGRGAFPDGTAWVLRYRSGANASDGTEDVALTVAVEGGTSVSSNSGTSSVNGPGPFGNWTTLTQGGRAFSSGLLEDDVVKVEIRDSKGVRVGDATIVEGNGHRAWLVEVASEHLTAVALDASGEEIGRVELPRRLDDGSADGIESGTTDTIIEGSGAPTTVPGN